jgi:L-alanine-DL-glutamate epimerase-like enolase superfamily enzyme
VKISAVDVLLVETPRAVIDGSGARLGGLGDLPVVVARVRTDTGLEGLGHAISLQPEFRKTLATAVREIGDMLIGEDPTRPEQVMRKIMYPANWIGPGGVLNIAASAFDVALWDIMGKVAGLPLWRLLGGTTNRPAAYDSGTLLSNVDALQAAAAMAVAKGHRALKMRPGPTMHGDMAAIVRRVRSVREAIGPDVALMLDVNQSWTPARAIQVGRRLEECELAWIEDPVPMQDIRGQADVARSLDVPICAGEYHYGLAPLLALLQERAADVLMIDLMRVGGITQFRKAAGLAEAFGVPVASHLLPEVFAHLIAAVPNGYIVEYMPWTEPIFTGLPELKDGRLVLSERPGHGLSLDNAYLRAHGTCS